MEDSARRRLCRALAGCGAFVSSLAVVAAAGAASAATLPNPCALLTQVHAGTTLAKGKPVAQPKLTKYGTGVNAGSTCTQKVGALTVVLGLSRSASGGFGGVKVTSTTHPSGLGSGDTLVVGMGPTGSAVDFVVFHRNGIYANLNANGAHPADITALARKIYKALH